MIKMSLKKSVENVSIETAIRKSFINPLIFYTVNNKDSSQFFVTFTIFDIQNEQMISLRTYSEENRNIIHESDNKNMYVLHRTPHKTVLIRKDIDFYTFVQDEPYFYYVNYEKNYVIVYTLDDFLGESEYRIIKLGSTFYKNNNLLSIAGLDEKNVLHIYECDINNLYSIHEVFYISDMKTPPHTLRKYKDMILMSHDFETAYFYSNKNNTIISSKALALDLQRQTMRSKNNETYYDFVENTIYEKKLVCQPGNIITITQKVVTKYKTTGTSPAHFEIDEDNDNIYISSHNFFVYPGNNVYVEPAVIDKYQLEDNKLIYQSTFRNKSGFRFTSHKFFRYNKKPYVIVFGQPNRLFVIDGETMNLCYQEDIEECELSENINAREYLNKRKNDFEIVPLEVSIDGKFFVFLSERDIYLYDFKEKKIAKKIKYIKNNEKLRTAHLDYLE